MFRYEDEVFGDSEPELDEGKFTFEIEGFFHHSFGKSMKLKEIFLYFNSQNPFSPFGFCYE